MKNSKSIKIQGSKEMLAIQWEFDSYHEPYYYGYFCLWINNCKVGNFEEISTLSIIKNYLTDFLKNEGSRIYIGSPEMSKDELFHRLYWGFFDGSFSSPTSFNQLGEFRDIYWLDEVGEYSFRDKIGMILVDEPELGRQRLIWRELKSGILNEFFLPGLFFDKTGREFLNAFNREIQQLP